MVLQGLPWALEACLDPHPHSQAARLVTPGLELGFSSLVSLPFSQQAVL